MSTPTDGDPAVAGPGSRVRLRDPDGDAEYTIVDPSEADPMAGRISAECPLARALLGRRAGDRLAVRTPSGLRPVLVLRVR